MATLVAKCTRCGAINSTHDCYASVYTGDTGGIGSSRSSCEIFAVCRACHRSSVWRILQKRHRNPVNERQREDLFKNLNGLVTDGTTLNDIADLLGCVSSLDGAVNNPPEHLPENLDTVMREANKCLSAQCWNAAAAMYRLALDMATKKLLPEVGEPTTRVRRSLGLRLGWLFENSLIPKDLRSLAECIQQDGNDGAHDGTISKIEAEDLHDFSFELLRRLYTEPERLRIAEIRRQERRPST